MARACDFCLHYLFDIVSNLAGRTSLSQRRETSIDLGRLGGNIGSAQLLGKIDTSRASLIPNPLPGDRWIQRHLGGNWYISKTNFLDKSLGSALTPPLPQQLYFSLI